MKKILLLCLMMQVCSLFAQSVTGFWKSVDDETGKIQSIVAIYEHLGNYYGRIIATFKEDGALFDSIDHPKTRAPGVEGEPFYSGLDIMWNLKPKGERYTGGHIIDPSKGRVYGASIWRKNENLIVRGELFFFGRNQTWLPASENDFKEFQKPELSNFVPNVPKAKRVR